MHEIFKRLGTICPPLGLLGMRVPTCLLWLRRHLVFDFARAGLNRAARARRLPLAGHGILSPGLRQASLAFFNFWHARHSRDLCSPAPSQVGWDVRACLLSQNLRFQTG